MAIDWGTAISGAIDIFQGQAVGGGRQSSFTYPGSQFVGPLTGTPDYSTWTDPRRVGVKCKPRRRRRRLLTEGDFNDLMRIATLPNKQNVTVALAKAVGRR